MWRLTQQALLRADAGGTCEGSTIAAGPKGGTLIFSTPFHDTKRANMTVMTSKTAGKSWEVWQNIDPGPSAYSALVALSESSVGLVYESRGYLLRQTFLLTLATFSIKRLIWRSRYGAISFRTLALPAR